MNKTGAAYSPLETIQLRSLVVGSVFALLGAFGGGVTLLNFAEAPVSYGGFMVALGAVSLVLVACIYAWRERPDFELRVRRVASAQAILAVFMLIGALLFSAWGPPAQDPSLSVFRPTYAFVPFVYLACSLLLPSRESMRVCWGLFVMQLLIVMSGLWHHSGPQINRDGELTLLLWLLGGNPLFLLMLGALPGYRLRISELVQQAALTEQLQRSEDRFQLVLRGLQVGAWGWLLTGNGDRWFSERFMELLGYAPEVALDPRARLRGFLHPDDVRLYGEAVSRALEQGDDFNVDVRMRMATGDYRWFNIRGRVNRTPDGMVSEVAGAIADVHHRQLAAEELQATQRRLEYLAYHDELTALHNRRYFNQQIDREHGRARRGGVHMSVLLIDIDHFKAYNDNHGHFAGDEVLQDVAAVLRACAARSVDVVARIGGEEFAVLLPDTDAVGAMGVAERIRTRIHDMSIPHDAAPLARVTVSVGAATWDPGANQDVEPALLVEEADAALYAAKNAGRNRIRHYRGELN